MKAAISFRMAPLRHAALASLVALMTMASVAAGAADLQVSPITLEFGARQQAAAVWLSNTGTRPLHAQVRIQAWDQAGGEDVLESSQDLVASPAMLEVAPGGRQMVRIIRLQPSAQPRERSYRLLIDELPAAPDEERKGLQFLLRYSIPVFVTPATALAQQASTGPAPAPLADLSAVRFSLEPDAGGSRLLASNGGATRLKLSQLVLVEADGSERPLNQGLLGYVLAGRSMAWPVPLASPLKPGQSLKARLNDDLQAQPLPLDGPGH